MADFGYEELLARKNAARKLQGLPPISEGTPVNGVTPVAPAQDTNPDADIESQLSTQAAAPPPRPSVETIPADSSPTTQPPALGPSPSGMVATESTTTNTYDTYRGASPEQIKSMAEGAYKANYALAEADAKEKASQLMAAEQQREEMKQAARAAQVEQADLASKNATQQEQWSKDRDAFYARLDAAEKNYMKQLEDFDPQRVQKNNSVGSVFGKIVMSIGAGAAAAGGNSLPNAMAAINNLIANDIEAQKAKISVAKGKLDSEGMIFKDVMESYKNQADANKAYASFRFEVASKYLDQIKALAPTAESKISLEKIQMGLAAQAEALRKVMVETVHPVMKTSTTTKRELGAKVEADLQKKIADAKANINLTPHQQQKGTDIMSAVLKGRAATQRLRELVGNDFAGFTRANPFDSAKWAEIELLRQDLIDARKSAIGDTSALQKDDKKFFDSTKALDSWAGNGATNEFLNRLDAGWDRAENIVDKVYFTPVSDIVKSTRQNIKNKEAEK